MLYRNSFHVSIGVTLFSPARNMNASEIHMMFETGVGIRVTESRGILDVMVVLPHEYNESLAVRPTKSAKWLIVWKRIS